MAVMCANVMHRHQFFFIVRLGTVLTLDGTSPGLDVSEYLDELIMATLDPDPAKRPDSWRKLIVCIDRVRNGRRMIRPV